MQNDFKISQPDAFAAPGLHLALADSFGLTAEIRLKSPFTPVAQLAP
jgi:hypothetical protein